VARRPLVASWLWCCRINLIVGSGHPQVRPELSNLSCRESIYRMSMTDELDVTNLSADEVVQEVLRVLAHG